MVSIDDFNRGRKEQFQQGLAAALRTILQQKHLYQSVLVPTTDRYNVVQPDKTLVEETIPLLTEAIRNPWSLEPPPPPPPRAVGPCYVNPPDLKLFCATCDRVEAYNLVLAEETFRRVSGGGFQTKGETD